MKIVLLVGILFSFLVNISARKMTTLTEEIIDLYLSCRFPGVTIGPNETISIETDPPNMDTNTIKSVEFSSSSVFSVPLEVFQKFPNLVRFYAEGNQIQEIKPDTFENAKNLKFISLRQNGLTYLDPDTFKGRFFLIDIFCNDLKINPTDLPNLKRIYLDNNQLHASKDFFTFE
jgi:Leucine-rich repeat (LRR) protein